MAIRKFLVKSKVWYCYTECGTDRVEYEIELDDEGEPFSETELQDELEDKVLSKFDRSVPYQLDESSIEEIDWEEVT